jgi:hypothetical protein
VRYTSGYVLSMHDNFISSVVREINKYMPTTSGAPMSAGRHRDATEIQQPRQTTHSYELKFRKKSQRHHEDTNTFTVSVDAH